ncbi:pentapeptide repeat-containing protein [Pseudomonas sp. Irchel s3b5]|uniref:pentapeptide repeat-containing protein n=1 Tax=Pseudomonas sp. Irchel s3b5 TaxID=2009077 RepID=UPI003530A4E9
MDGRLDLPDSYFYCCNLAGANFTGTKLEATAWKGCRGSKAKFKSALLNESKFESSDFNNNDWQNCRLSMVTFTEYKLTGG